MPRSTVLIVLVVAIAASASLSGPVRLCKDWWQYRAYMSEFDTESGGSAESSDWVVWTDDDGQIEVSYVFPNGPGDRAGLRAGDRFYMLSYQQYFSAQDLRDAIRGMKPGTESTYLIDRDGEYHELTVRVDPYPTFLYPRSAALWLFALWGFAFGAFFHILAIVIAAPLTRNSREARAEFVLIIVSTLWIVGNLLRLLAVELFGPPATASVFAGVFRFLTLVGLAGWIGFPALLLREVACTLLPRRPSVLTHGMILLAPAILAVGVTVVALFGHLGPITLEGMLVPILLYASCYIGAAALLVLILGRGDADGSDRSFGGWGTVGSAVIFASSLVAALSIQGVLPVLSAVSESAAGWLIVGAQLLAVAPVSLFSYGTLRLGKIDAVLSRALVYAAVLGSIFFTFVAGSSLLDRFLPTIGSSRYVIGGLFVVVVLLVFDRIIRRVRGIARVVLTTERQRLRRGVIEVQERMRSLRSVDEVVQTSISAAGTAFASRSAVAFVEVEQPDRRWVSSNFHPEPPYLTEQSFLRVWPGFESAGTIWARNAELNECVLPAESVSELTRLGAALAIPVRVSGRPRGLIVLGPRRKKRTVYNLEDVDGLRVLASQLGVAIERIESLERERTLARESSEAQLVALRSQINPHFLFNALNTILSHIREKPSEAEDTVESLASIFRYTLNTSDRAFVSLRDELDLVRHYLDVEQARFGDNLAVHVSVDPEAEGLPVPAFVVQTLVENAVKHGIERKRGGGEVRISATIEGDAVAISVSDSGVGIQQLFGQSPAPSGTFFGIGLTNVASRLKLLYGRDDLLTLSSSPDTGTTVHMLLPAGVDTSGGTLALSSNQSSH